MCVSVSVHRRLIWHILVFCACLWTICTCGRFVVVLCLFVVVLYLFCGHFASVCGCWSSLFAAVSGCSACGVVSKFFIVSFCSYASSFLIILSHVLRLCGRCESRCAVVMCPVRSVVGPFVSSQPFCISLLSSCSYVESLKLCFSLWPLCVSVWSFCSQFSSFFAAILSLLLFCISLLSFLHFLCLSLVVVFQLFEAVVLLLKVVVFGCYCRFDSLHSCFISRGSFCFSLKPFCIAGGRLARLFFFFTILQFSLHLVALWLTFPTGNVELLVGSLAGSSFFSAFGFFRPYELYSLHHRQVNNLSLRAAV